MTLKARSPKLLRAAPYKTVAICCENCQEVIDKAARMDFNFQKRFDQTTTEHINIKHMGIESGVVFSFGFLGGKASGS